MEKDFQEAVRMAVGTAAAIFMLVLGMGYLTDLLFAHGGKTPAAESIKWEFVRVGVFVAEATFFFGLSRWDPVSLGSRIRRWHWGAVCLIGFLVSFYFGVKWVYGM